MRRALSAAAALPLLVVLAACGAHTPAPQSPPPAADGAGGPAEGTVAASAPPVATPPTPPTPEQAAHDAEGDEADGNEGGSEGDYQSPDEAPSSGWTRPHAPILELTDAQIAAKVRTGLASLGSMSIGRTNAGALVNGIPLPDSEYWERVAPGGSYCTEETRDQLTTALAAVHARYPDAGKLFVGNISTRNGGHFPPHVSHQSGRDIDIGYFLSKNQTWYATATPSTLDVQHTWAFVRALLTETDVEWLFMDRSVQVLLHRYALEQGEDRAWVDSLFQYGGATSAARPIIVHVKGHATHIHIRFRNPVAEELGRRAYPYLLRSGVVRPPTFFAKHIAKKGETLSHLAVRYRTTVDVVRKTNGLKNDFLREGKEYRIPQTGSGVAQVPPVLIAPRRLPPHPPQAAVATMPTTPAPTTPLGSMK